MRIRFKPWARPELEASNFYRDNPEELRNKWIQEFKNQENPIHLELGCGKGQFISQLAVQNPNINYIAIDLVDAMLGLAKRNVEQIYKEQNKEIDNVLLTRFDIERVTLILGEEDNIKRIYINFCNPWPKGEVYFKTDDDSLFNASLGYFAESDFTILKKTYDLHAEPIWENNIETEHEKMFSEQGIKIKALIAKRN